MIEVKAAIVPLDYEFTNLRDLHLDGSPGDDWRVELGRLIEESGIASSDFSEEEVERILRHAILVKQRFPQDGLGRAIHTAVIYERG